MLVNACRPRHMHLHFFYVRVLVFVCACVFFFFSPSIASPVSLFPPLIFPVALCLVFWILLGFSVLFRRGGQSRDQHWKATADSWVIKVLERQVFSACILFQAFLKSAPACLLYQGLGIESRAVGQPSGPRPLLSSCENASTFTLSPSQTESNRAGRRAVNGKRAEKDCCWFLTLMSVSASVKLHCLKTPIQSACW